MYACTSVRQLISDGKGCGKLFAQKRPSADGHGGTPEISSPHPNPHPRARCRRRAATYPTATVAAGAAAAAAAAGRTAGLRPSPSRCQEGPSPPSDCDWDPS
eukprot:3549610-Alexandrium_andersonii.AAC.2